jgi:cellulose synthase/poly-beta-1,6-N-acetylglucosamine synthase-like glycosyltransferase
VVCPFLVRIATNKIAKTPFMPPFLIISIVFSVFYCWLITYFFIGWLKLKKISEAQSSQGGSLPFVSIIVPVRNESEHIQECLKAILSQTYPQQLYEVIVIDDYSTDPTYRLAREIEHDNLTVLDLAKYFGDASERIPNKKKAITIGIKNAKGSLIVTTDGDCLVGDKWLETMVNFYRNHDYKFITGPVMLSPAKNLLTLFQQIDVISMIGITGGTIANGFPTMCNGANLLYEKKAFMEVDGYKGNTDIPTGDDIFLMQKIEMMSPTAIGFVKNIDACVYTKPETSFSDFVAQRVRWTSKSTAFQKRSVTFMLMFAYLLNLLILIFIPIAFQSFAMAWLPLVVAFGTKFLMDLIFNISVTGFFKRSVLLLLMPVFEPLHIAYIVCIGVLGLSGKYTWKERKIS